MDPYLRLKQVVATFYVFALVILAAAVLVKLALALFPELF